MNIYEGLRHLDGEVTVFVNGKTLSPNPSLKIRNHSPTGFNWGYGGSGPSQLALAIMLDYFEGDAEKAQRYYQDFKRRFVSAWPEHMGWRITGTEIAAFIKEQENGDGS